MIFCKAGVTPPSILLACGVANVATALQLNLTITAARNGTHKTGSLHYKDAALDVRTKNLTDEQKVLLYAALQQKFPAPTFDVVFEARGTANEHIHVEDNRAK